MPVGGDALKATNKIGKFALKNADDIGIYAEILSFSNKNFPDAVKQLGKNDEFVLATKKVSELSEKKITKKQYQEILDGLSDIELKELSFENETTADKVKKCIDKISPELKKNGKCDKFAKVLINLLDKENITYEILGVWSDYPNIYSDKLNDCVSTNYYHYGVSVGDMVYDNVTLTGMEYHYWKMDMGGEPLIKIKNVDEINPQKFRKEMMNRNE